jgi:hypothetical protein
MMPLVFLIKETNRSTEIVVTIDSSIVAVTVRIQFGCQLYSRNGTACGCCNQSGVYMSLIGGKIFCDYTNEPGTTYIDIVHLVVW